MRAVASAPRDVRRVRAGKLAAALGIDEPEATASEAEGWLHRRRVEGRAGESRLLLLGEHAGAVAQAAKPLDARERAERRASSPTRRGRSRRRPSHRDAVPQRLPVL
ncbi:MAG TPA: hypothetical protein VF384_02930 [Planctomycetota bacterium]